MCRDRGGELAWRNAGPLSDLHRQVRRIVAMLRVARPLHAGRRRENGRINVTLSKRRAGGIEHCYGEFGGSHRVMLSGVDCHTWRRPVVLVTMRDDRSWGLMGPTPVLPG